MDDWVEIERDDRHIRRERAKAKELRNGAYFKDLFRRGVCHYCGKTFAEAELTLDHIVPLSRGGRSTKGNMVVCCLPCNQKKKYLTPAEMLLRELDRTEPSAPAAENLE